MYKQMPSNVKIWRKVPSNFEITSNSSRFPFLTKRFELGKVVSFMNAFIQHHLNGKRWHYEQLFDSDIGSTFNVLFYMLFDFFKVPTLLVSSNLKAFSYDRCHCVFDSLNCGVNQCILLNIQIFSISMERMLLHYMLENIDCMKRNKTK